MHAQDDRPGPALVQTMQTHVQALGTALKSRGLRVRCHADERGAFVIATNMAIQPDEEHRDDPRARMFGGLTQIVVLSAHGQGELAWWWQWSGATRSAPPEYEYLAPAAAIADATEKLSRVLAIATT